MVLGIASAYSTLVSGELGNGLWGAAPVFGSRSARRCLTEVVLSFLVFHWHCG